MAGIVDLYREHKDLLSIYFKSEQEAADCERRAEMGDDRAMRVMSLACNTLIEDVSYEYVQLPDKRALKGTKEFDEAPPEKRICDYEMFPDLISEPERDKWHEQAKKDFNFEALPFYESVAAGNRSLLTSYPDRRLKFLKWRIFASELADNYKPTGKGALRRELAPLIYQPHQRYEYFADSNLNAVTKLQNDPRHIRSFIDPLEWLENYDEVHDWNFKIDTPKVKALEICAQSGSLDAAKLLSKICAQKEFKEITTKIRLFSDGERLQNPFYNLTNAKIWERLADNLEGKGTSLQHEQFLKDFIAKQDTTPEGLYNIGYALFHNEHIGDKAKGLDYLKHAANLDHGSANAARELGEIYQNQFDANGNKADLARAHFWYKIAASTPMEVKDSDGKVTNYDGHPNAKARVAYLEKAYPELKKVHVKEAQERNPSEAHIRQYPESMFASEIPITDISNLLHDASHGGLVARIDAAVKTIDAHVNDFEVMTSGIQAKIDEIAARQLMMDGHVDHLSGEELAALRGNDKISEQQRVHERLKQLSQNRWIKETAINLGGTVGIAIAVPYLAPMLPGAIGTGLANHHGISSILSGGTRAAGYAGVMKNEVENQQAIIDELESRKIDTSRFPDEIRELALKVQELADSGPMQRLKKDEVRSRAIVEGYLRQRILKAGLEVARSIEKRAKREGIDSIDTLLDQFKAGDQDLYNALTHLCYGYADSRDMEIILQDVHAMTGDHLQPHEKALKSYVERTMKSDIADFMTRASQIDIINDLKLVNFETMTVDHTATAADLVRGSTPPTAEEHATRQVDSATKLALTCMFSKQFGVTHIGQYDVKRMFSFYLHRHGSSELIANELLDGHVSMKPLAKHVAAKSDKEMDGFVKRVKTHARSENPDADIPHIGDLFLRTCGYEYYLPQAVITSGRGNRFAANPESPVAYPMVNDVIHAFVENLSLKMEAASTKDGDKHQLQVGDELNNIIAQTFIDFFKELGSAHTEKFAKDREELRDAYKHQHYGTRFTDYQDEITADAKAQFPLFMQIYERNLKKAMTIAPEAGVATIANQIALLDEEAQQHLALNFPKPGSHQARLAAREDHRGENMTEQAWRFAGR